MYVFVYVCVVCVCVVCVCVGICMMWRPLPLITTDGYSLCYRPPNATSPARTTSIHLVTCTLKVDEISTNNNKEALEFKAKR